MSATKQKKRCAYGPEHTVAGNDKELIVVGELVDFDIGEGGDDLGLGCEFGALLEFEVSDGAREGEVAVDAAKVDKATSGRDAGLLSCGRDFMSVHSTFRRRPGEQRVAGSPSS